MDYSGLPREIIEKIASQHLETLPQFVSFSGVCTSWRSAAVLLRCPPVLLVPETAAAAAPLTPTGALRGQIHALVSPLTTPPHPPPPSIALPLFPFPSRMSDVHRQRDRYLRLHQEFITSFPVIPAGDELSSHYDTSSDAHCLASRDGWILRTLPFHGRYRDHLDLYLLNPFTGDSVPLPPLKSPYSSSTKAIISSSPDDDDDCRVFTLSGLRKNLLAWCKVGGGGGWTYPPKNCLVRVEHDTPSDASYSNGNLYLVGEDHLWVVHDILKPFSAATGPTVKVFTFSDEMKSFDAHRHCCSPFTRTHPHLCHLGGGGGQVHVVLRDYGGDYNGDLIGLRVFKLAVDESHGLDRAKLFYGGNHPERGNYWEQVWSLDGHAVFIGAHGQSFSLPAQVRLGGEIRGDHVYFASSRVCWHHQKSFPKKNRDGVFDLANQKLHRLADEEHDTVIRRRHPTFWFIPVPCRGYSNSASKNQHKKRKKKKKKEIDADGNVTST